jgi:putative FmdB family regulatory protein
MPTYEYECPEGHVFEKFQKMTDKPRAKCPVCGKTATRKISGGAGLVFKGSGFYITDYGKDGKGPRKETEKAERAERAEKAEKSPTAGAEAPASKGDAKPAAKADAKADKPTKKAAPE